MTMTGVYEIPASTILMFLPELIHLGVLNSTFSRWHLPFDVTVGDVGVPNGWGKAFRVLQQTFEVPLMERKHDLRVDQLEEQKFFVNIPSLKLTAILHLKIDGWKTTFPLGFRLFSGANCYYQGEEQPLC